MNIIVTNDDGFEAKGLKVLVEILRGYGHLTVVAPKKPQSGMSMAVSMGHRPIAVKHVSTSPEQDSWYLDGTPASCVKFAVDNILHPAQADLVVSGINHGSNAATAAIYSGTLGAAMEGAVNGILSVGVSLDTYDPDADFSAVADKFPAILDTLISKSEGRHGLFYNVNFPAVPAESMKGVRICHMGMGHWEREYRRYDDFLAAGGKVPDKSAEEYIAGREEGEEIYVMAGDFTDEDRNVYPADHRLLEEGYITVTPHNIDNTDRYEKERLCGITL